MMDDMMKTAVGSDDWEYEVWIAEHLTPEVLEQARALPLRRDIITLLTYVRDNKITGAKTSGNCPRKVIRELAPLFVEPPVLDEQIGDKVFSLRTEYDVWPLYFRHLLAEIGDLVTGGPARRIRLTGEGARFLEVDPLQQTLTLLTVWWFRVNWLVAFSAFDLGEFLPDDFELITLDRMRMLPVGRRTDFRPFAESLILRTGFGRDVVDSEMNRGILMNAVRRMVLQPCADFGIVELESNRYDPWLPPELVAFSVTPFGRALLNALALLSRDA